MRISLNNISKLIVLSVLYLQTNLFAQIDNIPAENAVYQFLKKMQVQGVLQNYDDIIIPLSRKDIQRFLLEIDSKKDDLSSADNDFLNRYKVKIFLNDDCSIDAFNNFPNDFWDNVITDKEKHLYRYKDSLLLFFIDPSFESRILYSDLTKTGASLINYGVKLGGSYNNWLGFFAEGSNGIVWGNRGTAKIDKRVEQSFTFNDTKINFFDNTSGYIKLHNDIADFQLGRERILWGRGYLNKMILSSNPQLFDFMKLSLAYKTLRYDFLHAWLVQPKTIFFIDSLSGEGRNKPSKYIAISRLGFTPSSDFSLGVSQIIIYANRPFEAAYLNPFLFWESAQRSLNDLDNSFMSIDGRYKITNGLEINSAILIDDLHFSEMFKNWATIHNRIAWQTGIMLTAPLNFEDVTLNLEYLQIRPYIFIHPGLGESLTYTNNSYMLGYDLSPNSTRFSAGLEYRLSTNLNVNLRYDHSIHGNNIYDANGSLIRNVGGNIYENNDINDSDVAYLLDGDRESVDFFLVNMKYEFLYGFYLQAEYQFRRSSYLGKNTNQNVVWGSLLIDF